MNERTFMLGNPFDGLGIRSYLELGGLIEKIESHEKVGHNYQGNKEIYFLKENFGKITLNYNKGVDLMQVKISSQVQEEIAKILIKFGYESRKKRNIEKYGIEIS